jgi:hypothetical protein
MEKRPSLLPTGVRKPLMPCVGERIAIEASSEVQLLVLS